VINPVLYIKGGECNNHIQTRHSHTQNIVRTFRHSIQEVEQAYFHSAGAQQTCLDSVQQRLS